jgi:hypothetical protein
MVAYLLWFLVCYCQALFDLPITLLHPRCGITPAGSTSKSARCGFLDVHDKVYYHHSTAALYSRFRR